LVFISGVKPKVSKLLRRHLSGESDVKEEVAPMEGASWKDMWNHGASPHSSNILRMVQGAREAVVTAFKWLVGPLGPGGCGSPSAGLFSVQSLRPTSKIDSSQMEGREAPLPSEPKDSQKKGRCLNPRDTKGRDHKGSPIRVCGLTKGCLVLDMNEGDQKDECWPVTSSEWSWAESESRSHQDWWGNPI
jgi:hypothetical protein